MILVGLAIDQIAQSGLSSLSVIYYSAQLFSAPISIGDNVWLGAGVVVLPGVKIGNNSVIAANSVVLSDVPENVLYAGNPAVFKRNI